MSNKDVFISITGVQYYFDIKPFDIGSLVRLKKEPSNKYDAESIQVILPIIGCVGHVANSPRTVARGTISAGKLYDMMGDECAAEVMFITQSKIIAKVYLNKILKENTSTSLEDIK
ncbi:MAG: hypothetical protein GYA87_06420 [Christensenellaceae bacterium]|nr:hypothetical protein [Christensenellaceae bacterium]